MSYYYELESSASSKFWKITLNKDNSVTVNWGRINTTGTTKTFPLSSKSEQNQYSNKKRQEKESKGYELTKLKASKKKQSVKKQSVKKVLVKIVPAKKKAMTY